MTYKMIQGRRKPPGVIENAIYYWFLLTFNGKYMNLSRQFSTYTATYSTENRHIFTPILYLTLSLEVVGYP